MWNFKHKKTETKLIGLGDRFNDNFYIIHGILPKRKQSVICKKCGEELSYELIFESDNVLESFISRNWNRLQKEWTL